MRKKLTLTDRAYAYGRRAHKRFRAQHGCNKYENDCAFCNGWTWGAVDGYRAGYLAAKREKR